MKRYIILFGALLAVAAMGYAYDGVARLFTDESGELFNSLSLSARYELLNNFSKGETVEVVNNLRTTESRITQRPYGCGDIVGKDRGDETPAQGKG